MVRHDVGHCHAGVQGGIGVLEHHLRPAAVFFQGFLAADLFAVEPDFAVRGLVQVQHVRPTVVLPQPLSPTRPRVSPLRISKDTSSTAVSMVVFRKPVEMGKYCFKWLTCTSIPNWGQRLFVQSFSSPPPLCPLRGFFIAGAVLYVHPAGGQMVAPDPISLGFFL